MPESEIVDGFELIYYTMRDGQKIYHTAVPTKKQYWPIFAALIENQLLHGGNKYTIPGSINKEFTDLVCEMAPGITGVDWIMQTIVKYSGRYLAFQREKDLLKIATYCFIAWLKKGCMLQETHDEDTQADGRRTK